MRHLFLPHFSALLLGIVGAIASSSGVFAQLPSPHASAPSQRVALNFKPPNRGTPPATAGGASRSACVTDTIPLTVLTPSNMLGLTTAARPTVFLFVPKTSAKSAEFVLKDANDNDVYRTMMPLNGGSGVISLTLPDSAPELEPEKSYRWYFSMVCRPKNRLEDVFVSAWIQRATPQASVLTALKQASPTQRPEIFAEAGFWYDTLNSLADLRRANPSDANLTRDWSSLLKSVGFSQPVSDAPLVMNSHLLMQ